MKKKRTVSRRIKSKRNYGWIILVLLAAYFMYVATFVFTGGLRSELDAVALCDAMCRDNYGVGTWQTAENSDACRNGVYFCECGNDFREEPTESNFKIDVNTGRVLSSEMAYEILNAREDRDCWRI